MSFTLPVELAGAIRRQFHAVIDTAIPAYEFSQVDVFAPDEERIIQRELDRRLHEPQLPNGGSKELKIIARLKTLSRKKDWVGTGKAWFAAQKWQEVIGWYYTRKPLNSRLNKEDWDWYIEKREAARASKQRDLQWFCELMLGGLPERVADFKLECKFLLSKHDGEVDRLVRLFNISHEKTGLIPLDAEAFHAPQKFRKFCLGKGNYQWGGNEKDLEKLHLDVARASAWRNVQQVISLGWRDLKRGNDSSGLKQGIWFFGDCAFGPDGKMILPDPRHGIFWLEEDGYLLSDEGREGEFRQKKPLMHPGVSILSLGLPVKDVVGEPVEKPDERQALAWFFREATLRLHEALGGHEAYMLFGSMLAYGAAPEIYGKYSSFPGCWIHGEQGSGKTKSIEWTMPIWGFSLQSGLDIIKNVTATGMQIAAEQYSNLPLWVDEFRSDAVDDDKIAILRSAYNRGEQSKYNPTGRQRKLLTAFIVSGESTTSDAATRSRYPHIQVAASRRKGNHKSWFEEHSQYFYLFGRFVLQNRAEFVERTLVLMRQWIESEALEGVEQRIKEVHGVGYGAFMAMVHMLESHLAPEVVAFKNALVMHCRESGADVRSEVNINVFWEDLITCWKAGEMPLDYFRVEMESYLEHPPEAPQQPAWKTYYLYLDPNPVISTLTAWLVKQRRPMPLKRSDLRDQLSKNPYWVNGRWNKRFAGGGTTKAWCINVDKHPEGYRLVRDEEYQAYMENQASGDPRCGSLFGIIDACLNRESNKGREE